MLACVRFGWEILSASCLSFSISEICQNPKCKIMLYLSKKKKKVERKAQENSGSWSTGIYHGHNNVPGSGMGTGHSNGREGRHDFCLPGDKFSMWENTRRHLSTHGYYILLRFLFMFFQYTRNNAPSISLSLQLLHSPQMFLPDSFHIYSAEICSSLFWVPGTGLVIGPSFLLCY